MKDKFTDPNNETPISPNHGTTTRMQQATKVWDDRIDSVKFWLVVLVIAAHVFMRKEFSDSRICTTFSNWIFIFSMPLFIFISGYFSRKKDIKDLWPNIWKLLEPLVIFHIIGLLFYVEPLSIKNILIPWYMVWYLLSLIYWRLLLQIIPDKILKHTKIVLITTICISILAGFLPFNKVLASQKTLALMPFFFLGYYMRGKNLYLPNKYKPLCAVFIIASLAILSFVPHRMSYLLCANPYHSISGAAIRIIGFAVAIPMSIAFLNVCYHKPWVARQGKMSMQYYIFHALMIPPSAAIITPPLIVIAGKLNMPMSFLTAAIITIVTTVGLALVLKIPYIKMLTNPSLLFKNKKMSSCSVSKVLANGQLNIIADGKRFLVNGAQTE